jgi:hypothetical protein
LKDPFVLHKGFAHTAGIELSTAYLSKKIQDVMVFSG